MLNLGDWFEEMTPLQWKKTLAQIGDDDGVRDNIRTHTRTGRSLGSDTFLSKLETILGRRVQSGHEGVRWAAKIRPRGVGQSDRAIYSYCPCLYLFISMCAL